MTVTAELWSLQEEVFFLLPLARPSAVGEPVTAPILGDTRPLIGRSQPMTAGELKAAAESYSDRHVIPHNERKHRVINSAREDEEEKRREEEMEMRR